MIKTAILGASGYAGNELVHLLNNHPKASLQYAQSKSNEGKKINDVYPDSELDVVYANPSIDELNEMDVVFLALPKEEAAVIASALKTVVIDLSPAHRFNDKYVYGLPEVNRKKIKKANYIANPGCYATACILGVLPLGIDTINSIAFDCKSGYSGGGKNKKYDFEENVVPYSLIDHYQKPEIEKFVKAQFSFTPHVVNAFRGLMATIHIFSKTEFKNLDKKYRSFYKNEPFVKIDDKVPDFKKATNTHYCYIGGFSKGNGHYILISVIDNLLKGAASQAVQNMNIRFGFKETDGLKVIKKN